MKFIDRYDAGERLANRLQKLKLENVVVIGLPRGGVVVAAEIADSLHAPLGVVLVKKIGHPDNHEYAIGAVAEGHEPIWDKGEAADVGNKWIENTTRQARKTIEQRRNLYHSRGYIDPVLKGKTVIIVDDGIATGLTFHAAVMAVYAKNPKRIIVAAPVATPESLTILDEFVDEFIILEDPTTFGGSVSSHYEWFPEIDEDEVCILLERHMAHGIV